MVSASAARATVASGGDASHEAAEHAAGADLKERIIPCRIQGLHGLGEADRRDELPRQQLDEVAGLELEAADREERRVRRVPFGRLELGAQRRLGRRDQRRVEGGAHGQPDHSLGAGLRSLGGPVVQSGLRAAHHDLAGAVEVGRPHAVAAGRQLFDLLVRQPDDGGHAAGVRLGGAQHLLAAPPHQPQRVGERQRAGGDQRRVLANAVAEGGVEAQPGIGQDAEDADGVGQQRRLRHIGARQRLGRTHGADLLEVEVEHVRGLGVAVAHLRIGGAEVAAHADGLGPLAGEHQCELTHDALQDAVCRCDSVLTPNGDETRPRRCCGAVTTPTW